MVTIEIFADVWCPFAHAGIRSMMARRRELGRDDIDVWIRAWPLEFVDARPLDAHDVAHEVAALRAQVAPDLFIGFDERRFPTTSLPALALTAAAYRRDARTGERISVAVRAALFEEGRDIADPDVLASIAHSCDMDDATPKDLESIRWDWREGERRGVKGSPHFFCGGVGVFCPSLDVSKSDDGDLHIRSTPERLDAFLGQCLP